MTPETYMKRYHDRDGGCGCDACGLMERDDDCGCREAASCPLTAEEVYPCSRPQPEPETPAPESRCCCKGSMADALRLLCGDCLGSLVDFDAFFFLTDALAIGSPLSVPGTDTDNIADLSASLRRFSPCNCDLLEISGTAHFAVPGSSPQALEDVDQLSLCAVKAVAFQIAEAECQRECGDTNYDRAVRALRRAIRAEGGDTNACGRCAAHCDCDNCCCAEGVLNELSTRNLSRTATLTVGGLVLQNVTVLGNVGSALVLADEGLERIYLVCANAIEALG